MVCVHACAGAPVGSMHAFKCDSVRTCVSTSRRIGASFRSSDTCCIFSRDGVPLSPEMPSSLKPDCKVI